MTEHEPAVVAEQLILVDHRGNVTEDGDRAAGGEVVQTLGDGTTRSTLFEVDRVVRARQC
jgi:predicted metal-dependent peptidase